MGTTTAQLDQVSQPRRPISMAEAVQPEVTPDNPAQGSADERQQKVGISQEMKDDLMTVIRLYSDEWALPRRVIVRNLLRRLEYVKGNQYISFDPYNFTFYDPLSGGTQGTQGGTDDLSAGNTYCYVTNVVQWLLRVFVATLGSALPATRFSPADPSSDLDNHASEDFSKANAMIERQNKAKKMLKQRLAYLGVAGVYFRHTRWVRDSRSVGTKTEPVYGSEDRQVYADHYTCPQCGTDTDADDLVAQRQPSCQGCGGPLSSSDFFPAMSMKMPVLQGYEPVAQGQVRQTCYTPLQITISPYDDQTGQDPLAATPMLRLAVEIDKAALRAMYPDAWEIAKQQGEGQPEAELDRMARLRSFIPGMTRGSALMTSAALPTYERTWIQPIAFNKIDEQQRATNLRNAFPTGVMVTSVNNTFLDAMPASLTDEWTMCTTGITDGANPPAVLDPAMDFQDRINDGTNTQTEYYDRLASPTILYDSRKVSKGLSGKYLPAGRMTPIKTRGADGSMGTKLQDVLYQPRFELDPGLSPYLQNLMLQVQLLTGITPQMWGGHQEGIDTASGQEQALSTATGVMRLYWDQVREEDAQAAKLAVRCLANHATEAHVSDVVPGDTGPSSFKAESIVVDNLKGEFNTYPDEEQGYPISFEETRQMLSQIIQASSKNPLIQELFEPMSNRRYFARFLAPGLEIPGQKETYKVLNDVAQLMKGAPYPAADPMSGVTVLMPSVQPDPQFDDLQICQDVVKQYAIANYELAQTNPAQFMNLRRYYIMAQQLQSEQAAKEAMAQAALQPQAEDQPAGAP